MLRHHLLRCLGHRTITSSVAHTRIASRLRSGAGVVDGVRNLLLD